MKIVGQQRDENVLGVNVYAAIMDEANFVSRPRALLVDTPVRHRDVPGAVGFIKSAYWESKTLWYVIEWIVEGFAPQAKAAWVCEIHNEMEVLAHASLVH